jgi:putative alpha-1,2-mannosidase
MSSWAVLSMLGMYSVDPASLAYELTGPVFPKAVLHLRDPYPGKSLTITASGAAEGAPYIQGVQWNGKPHSRNWISFHDLAAGGNLHFTLGATPDHSWGAAPADAPPSLDVTEP